MKRLTTDTPKDNLETALNLFYIKDHETWVRGYGPAPEYADVSLFDLTRDIVKTHIPDAELPADDDALSNMMPEWLMDGIDSAEGVVALLYTAAWAYAELRHKLMRYEDTGLEPDVCAEYKKFEDEAVSKGVPFKRIVELMNAQQEEKLVVLPCKVGDTVYVIGESCDFCETYLDEPERCMRCEKGHYVEERGFELWMLSEINESIFLTREEAEEALAGKGDANEADTV